MRDRIIARDREHLKELVNNEILVNGTSCSLNHIDISLVTNLEELFKNSPFNGDISEWNTSKVNNMKGLFYESKFTGDISKWDVSNVTNMATIFFKTQFNGDISKWNVSKVKNMYSMFEDSKFNGDISGWDVSQVTSINFMFDSTPFKGDLSEWKLYNLDEFRDPFRNSHAPIPYWAKFENKEDRLVAMENYEIKKQLVIDLAKNNNSVKRPKL